MERTSYVPFSFVNPSVQHGGEFLTTAHNRISRLVDEAADFESFKRALETGPNSI